ncbi:nitroreductase family protein [Candidatus Nitrosocosmicus sp. T]
MLNTKPENARKAGHNINSIFTDRWSPRSMTGEEISDDELMSLFEAARWAPSSFNNQPWRLIYSKRTGSHWSKFLDLLNEGNMTWAKDAGVLVVIISRKNFEYNEKPSITHQFDTGAAWENLALEASIRGIVAHGMQGFDYQKAKDILNIPDSFDVLAMIAIGKRGPIDKLPPKLQQVEHPNGRKPLKEIIMEGSFR